MPLPAMLTYNELNGDEVKHILENRFQQVIQGVPYFKPHITLPRVRMTLNVKLEVWADQPHPETVALTNTLTVVYDGEERRKAPRPSNDVIAEQMGGVVDSITSGARAPAGELAMLGTTGVRFLSKATRCKECPVSAFPGPATA